MQKVIGNKFLIILLVIFGFIFVSCKKEEKPDFNKYGELYVRCMGVTESAEISKLECYYYDSNFYFEATYKYTSKYNNEEHTRHTLTVFREGNEYTDTEFSLDDELYKYYNPYVVAYNNFAIAKEDGEYYLYTSNEISSFFDAYYNYINGDKD